MAVMDARYESLGQLLYNEVGEGALRILLYNEFIDDGVISPGLFYELENGELHYAYCTHEIDTELFHLKEVFDCDVKALELHLELHGGDAALQVSVTYADKFDDDSDTGARTDRVLQKHFGHTSAHYPPFEGTPFEG